MPMEASRLFWEGGGVVFTWRVDGAMLCMTSLLTHTISSSSDQSEEKLADKGVSERMSNISRGWEGAKKEIR